jgi:hypothetical protein
LTALINIEALSRKTLSLETISGDKPAIWIGSRVA